MQCTESSIRAKFLLDVPNPCNLFHIMPWPRFFLSPLPLKLVFASHSRYIFIFSFPNLRSPPCSVIIIISHHITSPFTSRQVSNANIMPIPIPIPADPMLYAYKKKRNKNPPRNIQRC